MATNLGINHGDHQHDSITSVTDCILGLREKINDKELPGLTKLIDDWFDPHVDVNSEQFLRRFLHVFKESDQDFTYEKIVGDYDDELQGVFNDFVDGKINADEAGQRYSRAAADKVPRKQGDVRKGGLRSVISGEPNILAEPINLLLAAPTSIPSRIRALIAKVFPKLKDAKRALYVPVSVQATYRQFTTNLTQTYKNLEFINHGRTIENTPALTCVPNTAQDVCDIVKFAKKQNMGVRVAGFRTPPPVRS